eukprot:COSAG01_NODE_15666_length_1313_cov_1.062603_1_plen_207_part_10
MFCFAHFHSHSPSAVVRPNTRIVSNFVVCHWVQMTVARAGLISRCRCNRSCTELPRGEIAPSGDVLPPRMQASHGDAGRGEPVTSKTQAAPPTTVQQRLRRNTRRHELTLGGGLVCSNRDEGIDRGLQSRMKAKVTTVRPSTGNGLRLNRATRHAAVATAVKQSESSHTLAAQDVARSLSLLERQTSLDQRENNKDQTKPKIQQQQQ